MPRNELAKEINRTWNKDIHTRGDKLDKAHEAYIKREESYKEEESGKGRKEVGEEVKNPGLQRGDSRRGFEESGRSLMYGIS